MSEEILKPIPYLEYSLMNHPEWFFYERAFFTSGKNKGEVVKERDMLPHRDTFGDRAKIWKKNHDVARNIIEVPAQETWCEIRNVGSDQSGKCLNGNIVLRPWRCAPHSSADAKVTKPVTDQPVLRMLNMVVGGHNAYRQKGDPDVYVAILIGTGTPYIRWSLEMLDTAGLPSRDYYSRPLLGYFFVPNKTKQQGAPSWKKNPLVTKEFFNAALLSLDKLRIARVFRFIQYRLVIVPFQSKSDANKWTDRVKRGTAWIGDTTHSSPPVPWFHGEGYQAIPQDFIDQLKTDKANSLLFPHPLVTAKEKTTIPKSIRHLAMYFPNFVYHLTEAAAKRGKAGSVMTLFDAEISFQMARPSFEARPQEQSLPDSLRSDIVAISRDKKGRIDAVFRGKKVAVGGPRDQDAEDEMLEEDLELYRKHPIGMSPKPKVKTTGKAGSKKAQGPKALAEKPALRRMKPIQGFTQIQGFQWSQQERQLWCWAACSQMIRRCVANEAISQEDIVCEVCGDRPRCRMSPYDCKKKALRAVHNRKTNRWEFIASDEPIGNRGDSLHLGRMKSKTKPNREVTWLEIKREIDAGRPIALHSGFHWRVCYGYHPNLNQLLIANPLKDSPETITFSHFKDIPLGQSQYEFRRIQ
jgi:hypothetical protein